FFGGLYFGRGSCFFICCVEATEKIPMKNKQLLTYNLLIAITAVIAFYIHTTILKQLQFAVYGNKIVLSYVINAVVAILILTVLYVFRSKLKHQLGFLFMVGSFLKFGCFFI